jgi:1,4-alpha-glucan branching enzyme
LQAQPAPTASVKPASVTREAPKGGHIFLELVRPDAKTVFVAGSFNEWKPEQSPLVLKGNGRWVGDLTIKPGRHEYLFVVDGQWLPDPNAKESVQNPFGGRNSILTVLA